MHTAFIGQDFASLPLSSQLSSSIFNSASPPRLTDNSYCVFPFPVSSLYFPLATLTLSIYLSSFLFYSSLPASSIRPPLFSFHSFVVSAFPILFASSSRTEYANLLRGRSDLFSVKGGGLNRLFRPRALVKRGTTRLRRWLGRTIFFVLELLFLIQSSLAIFCRCLLIFPQVLHHSLACGGGGRVYRLTVFYTCGRSKSKRARSQ